MTPTTLAPEQEAAIRVRAAEFLAERPDEPEWSSRRRGEAYFTAAYDRRALLAALDAIRAERDRLRTALKDAYETMDAACRWAANETSGVKTSADADRHMKGYDALLDGTVRAGIGVGLLRRSL